MSSLRSIGLTVDVLSSQPGKVIRVSILKLCLNKNEEYICKESKLPYEVLYMDDINSLFNQSKWFKKKSTDSLTATNLNYV